MFNRKPPHRGTYPQFVPAPLFEINVVEQGDALILHLEGELDFHACPRLARAFGDATTSGAETLLLDIEELTFLDVAGLELLLAESRRWAGTESRLMLTRGQGGVAELFRITGLEAVLPFAAESSGPREPHAAGLVV